MIISYFNVDIERFSFITVSFLDSSVSNHLFLIESFQYSSHCPLPLPYWSLSHERPFLSKKILLSVSSLLSLHAWLDWGYTGLTHFLSSSSCDHYPGSFSFWPRALPYFSNFLWLVSFLSANLSQHEDQSSEILHASLWCPCSSPLF